MTAAAECLAVLAELVAQPVAEWHHAAELVQAEAIDYDQFDEIRDETSYRVLAAVEAVLEAARGAGLLPALVTAT